jgi:hypothetical protein
MNKEGIMRSVRYRLFVPLATGLLLLAAPTRPWAQTSPLPDVVAPLRNPPSPGQEAPALPSPDLAAPVVRQGDFAVQFQRALGVGATANETDAESALGDLGVAPRNGWIADYPVTPDILGELQDAVAGAAETGRLPMAKSEAMESLDELAVSLGVPTAPYTATGALDPPPYPIQYSAPGQVEDYYTAMGPPVVTYYAPPDAYYPMYDWVPYRFLYGGIAFPGYFVLRDFHRVVPRHGRPFFVSNHFADHRNANRVFRVDPVMRFRGRTFAGIGAPRGGAFVATGVPGSPRTVFNAPRFHAVGPAFRPPGPRGRAFAGRFAGRDGGFAFRGGGFTVRGGGFGGRGHGGGHGR